MEKTIAPKEIIFQLSLIGLFTIFSLFLLFIYIFYTIKISVNEKSKKAQATYHTDKVSALVQTLLDQKNSYRDRNDAIWTLGQIGNPTAIPFIKKILYRENTSKRTL